PAARACSSSTPLVYSIIEPTPQNQFYFWPEYRYQQLRKGQNAIFLIEQDLPQYSMLAWFKSIFTGMPQFPPPPPAPSGILGYPPGKFESIKDLGVFPVYYQGRIYRWFELFECRNLR